VRLIQSLCAVCGSNLAGLTLLYIVLPCVADVSIVNCAVCQQCNKRTLLLLLLLTPTCDGRTDRRANGHAMTANTALVERLAGKNQLCLLHLLHMTFAVAELVDNFTDKRHRPSDH